MDNYRKSYPIQICGITFSDILYCFVFVFPSWSLSRELYLLVKEEKSIDQLRRNISNPDFLTEYNREKKFDENLIRLYEQKLIYREKRLNKNKEFIIKFIKTVSSTIKLLIIEIPMYFLKAINKTRVHFLAWLKKKKEEIVKDESLTTKDKNQEVNIQILNELRGFRSETNKNFQNSRNFNLKLRIIQLAIQILGGG